MDQQEHAHSDRLKEDKFKPAPTSRRALLEKTVSKQCVSNAKMNFASSLQISTRRCPKATM
jgi:hypothetical protein